MKSKKQKEAQVAISQQSQTALTRRQAISELFREAGIESTDCTGEYLGKTSVMFINSPSPESQDKAETTLHYHNQRKGR